MKCRACFGLRGDCDADGMGGTVSWVCDHCAGSGVEPTIEQWLESGGKQTTMNLGEVGAMIWDVFPKATRKQKVKVFDAFLDKFKKENPR